MPRLDLIDERLGQAGEGVVDRVADVAVTNRQAVGFLHELDALAGLERSIDLGQGCGIGPATVEDRVGHLAEGATNRSDPRKGLVGGGTGRATGDRSPGMDDPALEEPVGGIAEPVEVVLEETILQLDRVQEVESVLERDLVRVLARRPVDGSC